MSISSSQAKVGLKRRNDKKKYYKSAKKKKWNQLEPGLNGFLVTCNRNERQCLMEAYDLLNSYSEKFTFPTKLTVNTQSDDEFDVALSKEAESLKNENKNNDKEFQQVVTNAKNVLFIRSRLTDPNVLMDEILKDLKDGTRKGSRHIMRMLPVIGTCRVDLEKLKQLVSSCLSSTFSNDHNANNVSADDSQSKDLPTSQIRRFNVDFKARNNASLDRHTALREVSEVIQSMSPDNVVDYNNPEFTVLVEVVCKTVCLLLLKHYKRNKKYNLQQLASAGVAMINADNDSIESNDFRKDQIDGE